MQLVKGTVSVISSHSHAMIAMPDSQQYPWNLYLIKNLEDIVVFLGLFHFYQFSWSSNAQVTLYLLSYMIKQSL